MKLSSANLKLLLFISCIALLRPHTLFSQQHTDFYAACLNFEFDKSDSLYEHIPASALDISTPDLYYLHSLLIRNKQEAANQLVQILEAKSKTDTTANEYKSKWVTLMHLLHLRKFEKISSLQSVENIDFTKGLDTYEDSLLILPYIAFYEHFSMHQFEASHGHYIESLNHLEKKAWSANASFKNVIKLFLSLLYYYQNDLHHAYFILDDAIEDCNKSGACLKHIQPILYRYKASFLSLDKKNEEALQVAQRSKSLSTTSFQRAYSDIILGRIYGSMNNPEKSNAYFENAASSMYKLFGYHPEFFNVCDEYYETLVLTDQQEKADSLFNKIKSIDSEYLDSKSSYGSFSYHYKVKYHEFFKKKEFKKALHNINQIINSRLQDLPKNNLENPKIANLPLHRGDMNFLAMKSEACHQIYLEDTIQNKKYLSVAMDAALKTDSLFNLLYERIYDRDSRIDLISEYELRLRNAIQVAYSIYSRDNSLKNFKQLLYLIDKSHSTDLLRSIHEKSSFSILQENLLNINRQIIELQNSKYFDKNDSATFRLDSLDKEKYKIEKQIRQELYKQEKFVYDYEVFEAKFDALSDRQLINYYYDTNYFYICESIENKYAVHRINHNGTADQTIAQFYKSIYEPFIDCKECDKHDREDYKTFGKTLYDWLIKPLKHVNHKQTIITDKQIAMVPFEVLFEINNQKVPIVTQLYSISTHHLEDLINPPTVQNISIPLASYEQHKNQTFSSSDAYRGQYLGPLLHAQTEADQICNLFGSINCAIKSTPTAKDFETSLQQSDIVHLISHVKQSSENYGHSFIALNKAGTRIDSLYFNELDFFTTKSKMVVLSACETGVGELVKGEGINSVCKSLIGCGAASVVASIWSVNDKATSEIMTLFYKNLKDGQSRDLALYNAKLTYKENTLPEYRHPFYWAAFNVFGDNRPIEFKIKEKESETWIWVLASLILISIFLWHRRINSN